METVSDKRCFRRTLNVVVVGFCVMMFAGCRSISTLTNSMCPPTSMMAPALNQANQQPYSMQQPQPILQQPPIPMGNGLGAEHCVEKRTAVDGTFEIGPQVQTSQQDDSAIQAIVSMVDKLQAANDENAQLRKDLSQLTEEQQRHKSVALKATKFADKLRTDNARLKTDLTSWEDRLHQLESMVESRESHQEDALVDIDTQLDHLIATYESDMNSTAIAK